MNALEYARKNINFWKSSDISGNFDEARYPFVTEPLLSFSNPRVKESVLYGSAQSMKTVIAQIAMAYLLDIKRKSVLFTAQSDDDTREFAAVKLLPMLERIPSLFKTLKKGRYSATMSHWLWPTHELILSGPGENAQQSKSAAFLITDEAHRFCVEYPGALAALKDRMGMRWDRREGHFTTAADIQTEIDLMWHRGPQKEWNVRCPDCNGMFELLWEQSSREKYNGHLVFTHKDSQSISEQLDSVRIRCPHCDKRDIPDMPMERKEMDNGAAYVVNNPESENSIDTYRFNAFAPRWKPWRELYKTYLESIESAKLGNLAPYENWIKKQEVRTWTGDFPSLGITGGKKTYSLGNIDGAREGVLRVGSVDVQEGIRAKGEAFHLWGGVDEYSPDGGSRRLGYQRLDSWDEARVFQKDFGVEDERYGADCGARNREVFGACEAYHWIALKSDDKEEYPHIIYQKEGKSYREVTIMLPYSQKVLESVKGHATAGSGKLVFRRGMVPPGHCISRTWSKPVITGMVQALLNGDAGRDFLIARDMIPEYEEQLNSYVPFIEIDKKTNLPKKPVFRRIRVADHARTVANQNLVLAMSAGFYPVPQITKTNP